MNILKKDGKGGFLMSETNGARLLISSAIGAGIGVLCAAVLIFVMAAVLAVGNIPAVLIMPLATAALAIGGFTSGTAASKLSKSRGMACGAIAGTLFFLLVWASGGIIGEAAFGAVTAIKAGIMILAAALGGIIGVNKQ